MTFSFNLVEENWIPCVWRDGRMEDLSLSQVLTNAHELREVSGHTPLETASLLRLLLAVLHRVFGPASAEEWKKLWAAEKFPQKDVSKYLSKHQKRFDLFDHEHPFYQCVAQNELGEVDNLNKMIPDVPSSITAQLFNHCSDENGRGISLTPAESARALVAIQAFALGYQKFTEGLCAKGIIFFAFGKSLFETLMLNLIRYAPGEEYPMPNDEVDCPAWEIDNPFRPNRKQPHGYLDYLTWQNRRLLFLPEQLPNGKIVVRQMRWAPGLRFESEELDPMKRYKRDEKEGWQLLSFEVGRSLWRDSYTLLMRNDKNIKLPAVIEWLAFLAGAKAYIPKTYSLQLTALGMSKNKAKIEFFRSETMPLPLDYLQDDVAVAKLREALLVAENIGNQLYGAVFRLGRILSKVDISEESLNQEVKKTEEREFIERIINLSSITTFFWSSLELPFRELLVRLPVDPDTALVEWHTTLRRLVWQAFEQAADLAGEDARAHKAVVAAETQLRGGLSKVLPKPASLKGETK